MEAKEPTPARHLHKLFAGEHRSVSRYVRGPRLERCRRDLLDPRLADQSVATIAFRWGFGDLSWGGSSCVRL